ncbi:hypothetical protein [Paenibacillus sp.]|uniref:hypothetical protein n=1 Tax=Paenibacillus sp. TaxID=58172 RepID=UPI0028A9226E|nr:hypothetical protein [Paenibacillus sp.]
MLPLILLIFLFGCNDDGYILKGESESWKGDYRVSISGDNRRAKYTFYYRNDDWKDVGKYITVGKNELVLKEEGLLNRSIIITDDQISSIRDEESTKNVIIEWDGKKEEIELSR